MFWLLKALLLFIVTWCLVNSFFKNLGTVSFLVSLLVSFSIAIYYIYMLGMTYYTILIYFIYLTIFPIFFIYACTFLGMVKPGVKNSLSGVTSSNKLLFSVYFFYSLYILCFVRAYFYVQDITQVNLIGHTNNIAVQDTLRIFTVVFNTHSQLAVVLGFLLLLSLVGLLTVLNKSSRFFK